MITEDRVRKTRRSLRGNWAALNRSHIRAGSGTNAAMNDPFPIRPVSADEFPAFFDVGGYAFNDAGPAQPVMEDEFVTFEAERSLAAFDGASMVGTAASFTFRMAVPGGLTP